MKKAIEKYLRYLKIERNASPHTITSYKNDLTQFLNFCSIQFNVDKDQLDIAGIERLTIRLWLGELSERGLAKSSIARKVAAVRSFFKYCFKRGIVEQNPAHLLIVPKKDKPLPKTANAEDLNRMMELAEGNSADSAQNRAILETLYGTGIRLSELVNLNEEDINFTLSQIKVLGKETAYRPLWQASRKSIRKSS